MFYKIPIFSMPITKLSTAFQYIQKLTDINKKKIKNIPTHYICTIHTYTRRKRRLNKIQIEKRRKITRKLG